MVRTLKLYPLLFSAEGYRRKRGLQLGEEGGFIPHMHMRELFAERERERERESNRECMKELRSGSERGGGRECVAG